MTIQSIQASSAEEWLASLSEQGTTVIYKHSPFCGISARADREVEDFARRHPHIEVHSVDVVHQRPLSDALARVLGVRHSSPQVIAVERGLVVWNESHYGITAEALEEQLAR